MMTRAALDDLFSLDGRVAIVTGGSRGIGRAVAHGFSAAGGCVVVTSRNADACEDAAAGIRAAGGDAIAAPGHVGRLDDVERVVETAMDHYGHIDIVMNNAANALALPIGSITPQAWEKSLDVNARGPLFLVQAALPHLRPGASIVNVVSAAVFTHGAYVAMYTSGKAALLALTRSMAAELSDRSIRVNALAPGGVDTDMVRNNGDADAVKSMVDATLLGRLASPEEIVGPALFLASRASSYMTGHVLVVDGGLTVH